MPPDLYKALEVAPDASPDAIKDAWRRIAKASHPDRNPDDAAAVARFVRASEAYEILGDPARRTAYDASLRAPPPVVIVWQTSVRSQRRTVRRSVHAPPPSERDVQAVRSGAKSDDSVVIFTFGVLGLGPVALVLAALVATVLGPIAVIALAAGLVLLLALANRRARR